MFDHYLLNPGPEFYQRFGVCNRLPSFPKNIEVVPGQIEPIIIRMEGLILVWVMKWGMIPSWAKERGVGDKMFNIKAESVITKLGFRQSFKTKRCLVPFSKDGKFFSFAGIYDIWQEPVSGHEVYSYAIITTESNSTIKSINDRMPVILRPEQEKTWLDSSIPTSKLEIFFNPSSEILNINQHKF